MKTNKPYNLLLLALTAVFSCCSGDDYSDINTYDSNADAPLTITVTDGGYTSLSDGSSTRASEVGPKTVFTIGDKIGVFAVKDGKIVKGVENLCLTLLNYYYGSIDWLSDSRHNVDYDSDATYYAYYPYKQALEGKLNLDATSAETFFADVISKWTPATDQSTYQNYTAQDLMIAKGGVNFKSLSFTMKHQMALVMIDLPRTEYVFSSQQIPNYTVNAAHNARFNGFIPYHTSDGKYHYLVHPSSNGLISGSYTGTHGKIVWEVDRPIKAGNYKIFQVDKGHNTTIQLNYTLAIGDFYMKDGSLLASDTELTEEHKKNCLGVVMKVGKDGDGNWMDDCQYKFKDSDTNMNTIHGYILALYNAGGFKWATSKQLTGVDTNRQYYFVGYSNTQILKDLDPYSFGYRYPAAYYASEEYESQHLSPSNTSGWFMPSAGQCRYWYENRAALLSSIEKVGGDKWMDYYWSSSENGKVDAYFIKFTDGGIYNAGKGETSGVRSCLAF